MDNDWITKNPQKSPKKFHCKKCDYHCSNKKDFNKHLRTTKHRMDNKWITKNPQKSPAHHSCGDCGRKYKYRSGLCKHRKKCKGNMEKNAKARLKFLEARVKELEKSSLQHVDNSGSGIVSEVCELVRNQNFVVSELVRNQKSANENLHKTLKDILPTIGNNNNNRISINVFLNQHCKDAMNLTDFVDKIKISIDDLLYTKEKGYAAGISNIFRKHLTDMKPTERPFHCSDTKRLQFYVKDENKWAKDTKNVKIDRTIQDISIKQIKHLKEWESMHPDYLDDDNLRSEWHGLVEAMCRPSNGPEGDKIKKNLGDTSEVKNELIGKNTIISSKDK